MGKVILVCDDEVDVAQTVKHRLESVGFEVFIASDGIQSVAGAHKHNPDLILLDISMPAGGGHMVYEKLKQSTTTQDIPIMFFSALQESEIIKKTNQLGAAGYITKPYDPKEMISKIQKVLEENRTKG